MAFFLEVLVEWLRSQLLERKIEALEDMATKVRELFLKSLLWFSCYFLSPTT